MDKKKKDKGPEKVIPEGVNEPSVNYQKRDLVFFNSFEEMNQHDREEMAKLSPLECLQQLRQLINLAYGLHGYDPDNLPKKHSIEIIPYNPK